MKTRITSLSITVIAALAVGFSGCSKKSEPAPAPAAPAPAATTTETDASKAIADAAQAKIDAAKKEAEALKAQAEASAAAAKAKAAEVQALAEKKAAETQHAAAELKAQAASAKNSLLSSASSLAASTSTSSTSDASATSAAPATATSTLQSLAQNLTPANFSAWYDKASAESSGIISSLATKAAELGGQASPQFKSLYETALSQKKTFDEVSAQIKSGGITQWAALYPKLQTSWTDLSKSLTDAKALLAQFSK